MDSGLFAVLDLGLAFAVVFGLGLWQLLAVRRSIRRDRARGSDRGEDGV